MCVIFSTSSGCSAAASGSDSEGCGGLTDEEGSSLREASDSVVNCRIPSVPEAEVAEVSMYEIVKSLEESQQVSGTQSHERAKDEESAMVPKPHPQKRRGVLPATSDGPKSTQISNSKTDTPTTSATSNTTTTTNNTKSLAFPSAAGTASLSRPLAYDAALPPFPPSLFYAMYRGGGNTNTTSKPKDTANPQPQAATNQLAYDKTSSATTSPTAALAVPTTAATSSASPDNCTDLNGDSIMMIKEGLPQALMEDEDMVPEGSNDLYDALANVSLPRLPPALDYGAPPLAKRNTFTFNNTSNYTAQLHRYFYDAYNNSPNSQHHLMAAEQQGLAFGTSPNGAATFRSFASTSSARGGATRVVHAHHHHHHHHTSNSSSAAAAQGQQPPPTYRPTLGQEHLRQVTANGSSASVASTPTAQNRQPGPHQPHSMNRAPSYSVSSASSVSGYHPSLGYQPAMAYHVGGGAPYSHHHEHRRETTSQSSVVVSVAQDGSQVTMTSRRRAPPAQLTASLQVEGKRVVGKLAPLPGGESPTVDTDSAEPRDGSGTPCHEESQGCEVAPSSGHTSQRSPQKRFTHNPYQTNSQRSDAGGSTYMRQPRSGSMASATTPNTATAPNTIGGGAFPSPGSACNNPNTVFYRPHLHHYDTNNSMPTPPPAYGAQFYDALPWTESSARSSLHDDDEDDGQSMMLNEGFEEEEMNNNDYPPNPDYYGLPAIDTPVPQMTPPVLSIGGGGGGAGPPSYSNAMSGMHASPPPAYVESAEPGGKGSGTGDGSTPTAPNPNPTPPQYGFTSTPPQYSSSSQYNLFTSPQAQLQQQGGGTTNNQSSTFNPTPNHGKNVHSDALQKVATFVPFYDTNSKESPPPARRYRHDYHAQPIVLRVSSLPLERLNQAASDMQDILDAVCGGLERDRQEREALQQQQQSASASSKHPPPSHHSHRRITVRVEGAEKSLKSNSVYVFISTAEESDTIVAAFQKVTVLMDRRGFHLARSAEERAAVAAYCDRIRNLPQRARHWRMDGLPSTPISFKVV